MTTRLIGVLCWTARIKILGVLATLNLKIFRGEDPATPFQFAVPMQNTFWRPWSTTKKQKKEINSSKHDDRNCSIK